MGVSIAMLPVVCYFESESLMVNFAQRMDAVDFAAGSFYPKFRYYPKNVHKT